MAVIKVNQVILLTSAICCNYVNKVEAADISKHLTTIIEPSPIKRFAPKYPINAARSRREGWAKMSFIIEKDGSVSNVLVTETSGSSDFANAAKNAVLKWQYQPALENGQPIQQCVNSVQIDFLMNNGGEKGVTRRFRSKYQQAELALKNKEYEQVKGLLTEFSSFKKMHLNENNHLHLLSAKYAEAINDQELQLFHLYRISLNNDQLTTPEQKFWVLNQRLYLEVSLNKFHAAHNTFNRLGKLSAAEPYMNKYQDIMAKVDRFISSQNDLIVAANIKNRDYWSYPLVRSDFSLTNIEGSINKLDIRCANKRHVYTVEENNTWSIPNSWKRCSVYVFGENDTSFNLVEHPLKS